MIAQLYFIFKGKALQESVFNETRFPRVKGDGLFLSISLLGYHLLMYLFWQSKCSLVALHN